MTSKITLEIPNGTKLEYVHAYGITRNSQIVNKLPSKNFKLHIDQVRDLEIRDDDIYLATFPKCGTHWVWEMLVMLRRGNVVYETKTKSAVFLDFRSSEEVYNIPSPPSTNDWRVRSVRVRDNELYTTAHILSDLFYPWFKYVKEWERFSKQHTEQILNLYYEDIKEDPVREIKKINSFLGTNRSDELIEQISVACDFQNLKKADAEVKVQVEAMKKYDRLPSFIYRKGQVGDWKNQITVHQNEKFDQWLEENLIDTELSFRYTL